MLPEEGNISSMHHAWPTSFVENESVTFSRYIHKI